MLISIEAIGEKGGGQFLSHHTILEKLLFLEGKKWDSKARGKSMAATSTAAAASHPFAILIRRIIETTLTRRS